MKTNYFSTLFLALGLMLGGLWLASCATAKGGQTFLANLDKTGVILDGHDPVAFFTDNKPVKGNASINFRYHDATYWFATEDHKKLFVANPEKYAPQFGAYCGYAVSQGHLAPIDVDYFQIIDGRLILQNNKRAFDLWGKDPKSLEKADKYWPQLLGQNGRPLIPDEEKNYLVNNNKDGFVDEGYDVVSYFTDGKPVKGDPKFIKLYKGSLYAFATEEHKKMFGDNPDKYAPLYGGFCAYAVSVNRLRPIDPQFFQIVDNHLLLQHSQKALDLFSKDIPGSKAQADLNWPGLVSKRAGKPVKYDEAAK